MEGTLVGGGIAKEAGTNLISALILNAQTGTGSNVMASADNPIGAKNTLSGIGNMQRTALALAITGLLAKEFRHHVFHVATLGEDMPVTAMGRGDVIIIP